MSRYDPTPAEQEAIVAMTERAEHTVHLVRNGRFPHVVAVTAGVSVDKDEALDRVTCGLCLGAAGEFLGGLTPNDDPALQKLAKRFCDMYGGDVVRDSGMGAGRVDQWLVFTWFRRAAEGSA